jgi:flagellar operon protein
MSDSISIGQLYPQRISPKSLGASGKTNAPAKGGETGSFRTILDEKLLSFSQHAQLRLQQRGITLEADQIAKLQGAIDKAASKGSKESLVLFQDMAFIVNIKNRTVVTAMDDHAMKDHVFTQIDSTVVVR